jgi:hypothetical protein
MLYEVALSTAGHVIVAEPAPAVPVTPVGAEGTGGRTEVGVVDNLNGFRALQTVRLCQTTK